MKTKSYVLIDPAYTLLVEGLKPLFDPDSTLIPCSTTPVDAGAYLHIEPEGDGDGAEFGGSLRLPHAAVLLILDNTDVSTLGFSVHS